MEWIKHRHHPSIACPMEWFGSGDQATEFRDLIRRLTGMAGTRFDIFRRSNGREMGLVEWRTIQKGAFGSLALMKKCGVSMVNPSRFLRAPLTTWCNSMASQQIVTAQYCFRGAAEFFAVAATWSPS